MKTTTRSILASLSLIAIIIWITVPSSAQQTQKPAKSKYFVAAYIWPSYHPDDRAKIFWPMGIGEWETVMKNEPKYPGHLQPRYPLWGYVNEADPYVMRWRLRRRLTTG